MLKCKILKSNSILIPKGELRRQKVLIGKISIVHAKGIELYIWKHTHGQRCSYSVAQKIAWALIQIEKFIV